MAQKRIVVAPDNSGDFKTIQEAIDSVPDNNKSRVVIKIKPGVYREQIRISKPFINLLGEDAHQTVITHKLSAQEAGNTRLAFTAYVSGDRFRAENVTFENSFGVGSQAVALFIDAEDAIFENCRFLGWQDTLFVNGTRHIFKDCYIEGHVDFIFGSAAAFFEACTIHSKGEGYVTAQYRTSDDENTGFVFMNCRLTGKDTGKGVYLGRPWRPYARVVFIESWLGPHIRPEGWDNWRDPAREKTAWFAEYKSRGPGANPAARVAWSKQLAASEVAQFTREEFFKNAALVLTGTASQAIGTIAWDDAQKKPEEWYGSAEASRIADLVLLYQRNSGGWPKNIDMAKPLSEEDRANLSAKKNDKDSTIDNGATFTQLSYLARVYTAQREERYRESFLKGLDYLLKAQYPNGGWPQFYPDLSGYYKHITFNDNAMIGVMKLLRDVAAGKPAYGFVDEARRARAAKAVEKGVDVILKTQVIVNGKRTVWCAQHDEVTFAPAPARKYEVVSLSGGESVEIVRFLMSIKNPSPAVVDAIESAVKWFEQSQLKDAKGEPVWARFYEIGTNRPIFVGRD
ncbi:MAG TPA: pectate lyase, partial [Pyrinomonadaceae bacterium]|nr:pectate lyase [Pyrinomonadaceae bacterium]